MKKKKISLTKQLVYICVLIVGIIFIALGIILPKELLPIYEENIYNKLKQPLTFINKHDDINNNKNTDIAYIYYSNNFLFVSSNINDVVKNYDNEIVANITDTYGKFVYKNKLYYYYHVYNSNNEHIISITNDKELNRLKNDALYTIFLITGISFTFCSLILILWSNNLVNDIIILKKNIQNIDNDNYDLNIKHNFEDEIDELDKSIQNMHEYLINNESYKNQLYQNISHDFKTPIAVIKSYIEAANDGIETNENCLKVINEQINKLENKVHSLLYLNKLNYLKEQETQLKSTTTIKTIIMSSVDKFKLIRPELDFKLELDDKETFRGTVDMWEAIIDNILNNFMRYSQKEIKIIVKNQKILLFNDGENIDKDIINNIFTPYKKGLNGMFGLGLSVVKKTLELLNYDIIVKNVKNGVNFIIK